MHKLVIGLAAALMAAPVASAAPARKAPAQAEAPYGRDLISVATPGRRAAPAATADCIVWVNAEGLGVGPAQLGGLHGLVMHLNEKPLPTEGTASFAAGLADVKAAYPGAPAWLVALVETNRAAIEARCAEDHLEPVTVYRIRPTDRR